MHPETAAETRPSYWPDLAFIRTRISIREVARELGLNVSGNSATCWRGFQHKNGDRTPSLSFTKRNRAKCHVCDPHAMSVPDLVMAYRRCELRDAVEWVCARWHVPLVEKGRHVNGRALQFSRARVGVSGFTLEELVRRGFWATLSKAAQSFLVVVLAFRDSETQWATLSFRALARFAGLSHGSISSAQRELCNIGLLSVEKSPAAPPLRACNRYLLTLENPAFLELLDRQYQKNRSEVEWERAFQKRRRQEPNKTIHTLGSTLSTSKSTEQSHALISGARDCMSTPPFSNELSRGESQ